MGRLPRFHFAGAVYHAMARGVDRRDIFFENADRLEFMNRLRLLEGAAGAKVLAHCLMNNHFHLAIRVGAVPLSSFMQRLLGRYSRIVNLRHDRIGHLFQDRYKAYLCTNELYLPRLIRYIHMNPVRAGLVARPGDWRWSSFTGSEPCADDLTDFDPWPKEGTREFDLCRNELIERRSMESIGERIRNETGFDLSTLRARLYLRTIVAARRKFVEECVLAGYSQKSIAAWLRSSRSAISRFSVKSGKWEA